MDIKDKTTPEEFLKWISGEGFDICVNVMIDSDGNFGSPLLFGLDKDSSKHHALPLRFWSNQNKDKSMELTRDLIHAQGFLAVGFLFKANVRISDKEQAAILLVTSLRDSKDKTLYVRPIKEDGTLDKVMKEPNPSGRLVDFWKNIGPMAE